MICGKPAETTQKELGITDVNPYKKMFGGDVLICDEVSMIDQETIYYVLRDLIDSYCIPTVMLTKNFLQANDSNIFGNIQKVKNGESNLTAGDDFEIITAGMTHCNNLWIYI